VAVADPDAPKGNALETWQNKLFVAGQGTSRVSWSPIGDPTNWVATDFNDLRSKDNERVVNLKVASGLDISGRAGLLACKQESSYRIYDSTTGAYEVVDATVGAASNQSVVAVGPKIITLSKRGIFWWAKGWSGCRTHPTVCSLCGTRHRSTCPARSVRCRPEEEPGGVLALPCRFDGERPGARIPPGPGLDRARVARRVHLCDVDRRG
jgi:hypothetical protein